MRVVLDGTPLLGQRTGIGTYVEHLVAALAARGGADAPEVAVTAFTGRAGAPADLPEGVAWRHRAVPARLLRAAWMRSDHPGVELLSGHHDVFHATNFVLPPTRAAGVLTVHDLTYERFPELVSPASLQYRTLVPRGLRRARAVLTPSRSVADEVTEQYGLPPERVHVTPLGVSARWFSAQPPSAPLRARHGLPANYVVFVGTREPRKNLATVLAARRSLGASGADAPALVLVGASGWGDLEPAPGTVVLPHLPAADVRAVVAGARALLVPSLYEGFGLPVVEGLASGVPVLCSDLPVLREVGGDHVRTVEPTDPDAWAQAMLEAMEPWPASAVAGGRAWARTFTWERCAELTVGAYRAALDG